MPAARSRASTSAGQLDVGGPSGPASDHPSTITPARPGRVHHADCGMLTFTDESLRRRLKGRGIDAGDVAFLPFDDVEDSLPTDLDACDPWTLVEKPPQPGLRDTVHAVIVRDGEWYVADCAEIAVVTQGHTLDETIHNLREAITLHLEGEEAGSLGIVASPRLVVTLELRTGDAAA